jgi:hypothetical protein
MVDGSGADWNAQKALELPTLVDLAKPTTLVVVVSSEGPITITPQAASAQRPVRNSANTHRCHLRLREKLRAKLEIDIY